jgi:class 3 adenylate cyclase/tetratricopeptide (TPR) repeat protein
MVLCPACGEENPGKFRLCGYCGTPLAQDAAPAPAVPAPVQLPAREIRKTVTLVFTDIKDSTALTGSIDAEAMNEIKARYFGAMADQIRAHGGEVEKNVGDAIMAVFGRIRAHEDDALRAVRAAHGMQVVLAQINEDFQRFYGVRITNRTGVNTGEIVANTDPGADQNLATGDAVNVAARLEQNAPAGEVLIGQVTYDLVQQHVEVERLMLELKGKPEPVPAYRVIDVHLPAPEDVGDTPLLGRDVEVSTLREAFAGVERERRSSLTVVTGEAGVGKTRLIADFVGHLAERATVVRGRCLAYGDGITFWPLLEIVRAAAGIVDDDSSADGTVKIAALLPPDDPDRDAVVARVAAAIGLSTSDYPVSELFWGARKLLEAQAVSRPLVVVVDDIHWAEATFLELFDALMGSPTPGPILVLCSARPEVAEEHPDWWGALPAKRRIELGPLGAESVESIIDQVLGEARLSPETRQRVVDASEGNPLYVEQLVSMLRDSDSDDDDVVVPPTIAALLSARLDALSQPERAVIEPASVIGLHFAEPALHELVPDVLRNAVETHLKTLTSKQFVQPSAQSGDEDEIYRFHHVLVRDATYGSLLKRARATFHEKFVVWAERVNRERGRETEFEEIHGYHLEQAVRYRSELGPLDDQGRDLARRAATKLGNAGTRALERKDMPAAANLLHRAVDLLDQRDPMRLELVPAVGEALMALSRLDEAADLLGPARAAAAEIGERRHESRIRLRQLTLEVVRGETEWASAQVEVEALLQAFTELGDHGGTARAWRVMSMIHANAGRYAEMAEADKHWMEEGRAAGEESLVRQGATVYAQAGLLGSTPVPEALANSERSLEAVRGDRWAEAIVRGVLAQLHAMNGDFDAARDMYRKEFEFLRDLGVSREAASTSIESAHVELLAGDLAAAESQLRRDDAQLAGLGERYFRSTVAGMLARVLLLRGETDEAEGFVVLAEALSDDDDAWSQVLWRSARARLLVSLDPARAREVAVQAVKIAATTSDLELRGDALTDQAEVLVGVGAVDEGRESLVRALELYHRKGDATSAARTRQRLSELTEVGTGD